MSFCDLHVHSFCSDGTFSPTETAKIMKAANSAAFALTDHETVTGIKEARIAASSIGIDFVPGVEISCDFYGNELHIVGLFINEDSEMLNKSLADQFKKRELRNEEIYTKLKAVGITVDFSVYDNLDIINRSHFAKSICEQGLAASLKDAFRIYLDEGCPAYVKPERMSFLDAINSIKNAGGLTILAHLSTYKKINAFDAALELKKYGLDGIEGFYYEYCKEFSDKCISFTQDNGFLISGGSDFHGGNKPNIPCVGSTAGDGIPFSVYENLYEFWRKKC